MTYNAYPAGVNAANHTQSTDDTSSDPTDVPVYVSLEDFYDGNLYAAENLGMFKKFLVIGFGLDYLRAPASGTVFIPTDTVGGCHSALSVSVPVRSALLPEAAVVS